MLCNWLLILNKYQVTSESSQPGDAMLGAVGLGMWIGMLYTAERKS